MTRRTANHPTRCGRWRWGRTRCEAGGMTPESSERTRQLYDEVAAKLADAGVVKGSMFGMPCLKVGKKMLGGIWGDAMNFKLPPEAREPALAEQALEYVRE